jgi:hypothetical protein
MLMAVGLLGMPGGARGQALSGRAGEPDDSAVPRVAGTAAEFALAINPYAAEARDATNASRLRNFGNSRFCMGGTCALHVPFNLPSGAIIVGLGLLAHDQDPFGEVAAQLLRCPLAVSCSVILPLVTTSGPAVPEAIELRGDLPTPHTVDNKTNSYAVFVSISGGTDLTRLIGLRVFYRLDVSPAPAVATFSDVPTSHPFFRFIEALAASGITSGCGSGNYCPDTRGQMAVFLSLGLGLHFAP